MRKSALILLLIGCVASAHDIGTSNGTFLVRSTGIDAELYMGFNAGALLIANDGEQVVISAATYADFSDRLQAAGAGLFTVTYANGAVLAPDACAVSLTEQSDIRYDLHYPLPSPLPCTLTIRADYINRMVAGHAGSIYVLSAAGDRLGLGEVQADSTEFQADLPAMEATAPPPAAPAAGPAAGRSPGGSPWFLWALLAGSALIIAAIAVRGAAKQNGGRYPPR